MKNIIILGSGRSGTSMLAGLFAKAGYFFGGDPHPPRHSNPKGFFETKEINGINEAIIANISPQRPTLIGNLFLFRKRPTKGQRWLSRISLKTDIRTPLEISAQIKALVEKEPFCFKDPRFSYTLPAWRPYLKNHLFLCVFRDPATTVSSILKECSEIDYLKDLIINEKIATEVWRLMYTHILEVHAKEGDWLFIHYNQFFDKEILKNISYIAGVDIDISFPEKSLKRSVPTFNADDESLAIYNKLCKLSGHSPK